MISLKTNFFWSLISSLIYGFSQWMIVSLITKIGDVSQLGMYSFALAVTTPIFLLFSLNLKMVIATDVIEEKSIVEYFAINSMLMLAAFLLTGFLVYFSSYSNEVKLIILLVSLIKIIESINDVFYGKYQQKEDIKRIAISKILKAVSSILVFSAVLLMTKNLAYSLIIQLIIWLLILIFNDGRSLINLNDIRKYVILPKKLQKIKTLLLTSLPLGIGMALDSLNTNIPRYFIAHYVGEAGLGIFTGITYIMIIGQTVIFSLAQVILPRLSKLFIQNKVNEFKKILNKLLLTSLILGTVAILASWLLSDFILTTLYSEDFRGYRVIFVLTSIGAVFWYISGFYNAALMATRVFKVQFVIFGFTALVTLICSALLIPTYGLIGASFTLIIGFAIRYLISMYVLNKILREL